MLPTMRIGVLTGGGDCPGLNAVIRAAVTQGINGYGHEFVGFRDGWKGPLEGLTRPLGLADVADILIKGGTILGSSRTNPYKVEGGLDRIRENVKRAGVDALIAIGGEDTLGVAKRLTDDGLGVVGVPKTIDNDLDAPTTPSASTPRSPPRPSRSTGCGPPPTPTTGPSWSR
jgi:ATP-dependent phosphofructokinase / diphosphate-dependent phosphofructokinase